MLLLRSVVAVLAFDLMGLIANLVHGQDYPNKPIRIITAAPGAGSDFAARLIAQGISGPLGQPVIVDNRISILTAEVASKALPDGYTLFVQGTSLWTIPLLRKVPYDVVEDFSPISQIDRTVAVVAVHSSVPARTIKELIALAKAKPGDLTYSGGAIGGTSHLAGELFKSMAGVNLLYVPYKATPLAVTALIAGEVQVTINDAGLLAPHAKTGKLRALAVTSIEPSELAPGLPTVAAAGVPGYESVGVTGIFTLRRTPGTIINRLNHEIVRALSREDVKRKFFNNGSEVVASSPQQLAARITSDVAIMSKVIKEASIKVD